MLKHPAVALAAVIGVPDELRVSIAKAFVRLAAGHQPSEALMKELQTYVKRLLAAYEYPRQLEFIDKIPTTSTGKLQRSELRQREELRRLKPT